VNDRPDPQLTQIAELTVQIYKMLPGYPPAVAGAALCDCLARIIAGHLVSGDAAATAKLRQNLLEHYGRYVEQLIEPNAKAIGSWIE
jgi:hypothetical protein